MTAKLLVPLALAATRVAVQSASAERIYRLVNYPDLQNGHTLRGTITTTDEASNDGLLATEEILDWEWGVSGLNTYSASYAPPPNPGTTTKSEGILISLATIELPLAVNGDLWLRQFPPPGSGRGGPVPVLRWFYPFDDMSGLVQPTNVFGIGEGDVFHPFWSSALADGGSGRWVVATAIPEPSTLYLVLSCSLALPPIYRRPASCP